ncbi:tyrosine-type recombinase/integrase [Thiomonas intermedia]|uniref:tyrosine-type recombinase/integrase n=1 Tax=Thiomonas intermedia TaxID=926 RepID=UPI001C54F7CB|nr:site-specific integrase [Thiomonas intermedia]
MGKLTARQVQTLGEGFHSDGGNLYLRVKGNTRAWVFRIKDRGRVREIGLGGVSVRGLKDARLLAEAMRKLAADGIDPASALKARAVPAAKSFEVCAQELIAHKEAGWRNPKHAQQWANTLRDYVYPSIGRKAPSEVTVDDVEAILRPIWTTKTETATRVRQRIEAVLDYAAVKGLCDSGRNPARWKGLLDKVFSAPRKVTPQEHHAAAGFTDVPRIMAALASKTHVSVMVLRFTILTACRSMEVRGATWAEMDLQEKMWVIPAQRMKASKEHRVPLSDAAVEILHCMVQLQQADQPLVFPGARGGLLSDVAVNKTLHAVAPGVTVHGFRSAFRTWCEEETSYPRSVTEAALAHVNADKVEAAYQRSDLYAKRKRLMQDWADFCRSGAT